MNTIKYHIIIYLPSRKSVQRVPLLTTSETGESRVGSKGGGGEAGVKDFADALGVNLAAHTARVREVLSVALDLDEKTPRQAWPSFILSLQFN